MPVENIKMKTNSCLQGVHNLKGEDKHETLNYTDSHLLK